MREWYTTTELSGLPGMPKTVRGVLLASRSEGWTARKRSKGKGLEYHVDSLRPKTRSHLRAFPMQTGREVSAMSERERTVTTTIVATAALLERYAARQVGILSVLIQVVRMLAVLSGSRFRAMERRHA